MKYLFVGYKIHATIGSPKPIKVTSTRKHDVKPAMGALTSKQDEDIAHAYAMVQSSLIH